MVLPMRDKLISTRMIFAVLGLTLASTLLAAAQQAPAASNAPKTAGQQYKNIQVLKDVPAAQFIPTMRYIAAALGVECEFCHLGNRGEDTDNKQTARKMITMMLAIDKTNFNGQLQVTCFTCHNGNHQPGNAPTPTGQYTAAGTLAFYKPTAPGPEEGEPMSEAYRAVEAKQKVDMAASMPTSDQILAKYVAALGGEQALRKVTARTVISTAEMSPNVRGAGPTLFVKEEQDYKAPNLYVATIQTGTGSTSKGFDGTDSWTQNPNGVVAVGDGTAVTRAKRAADVNESLNLKQEYTRLAVRGIEKVGDRDAYVVLGFPAGDNPERLYFDKETGLLLRKSYFDATALGNYTTQTDYEDYRDVSGVKFPFLIRTISISPADTVILHVEKVDDNPTIDASKFTKPASAPRKPAGGQ